MKGSLTVACSNCLAEDHFFQNCPLVKCLVCGETGHSRDDCTNAKKRPRSGEEEEASVCRGCGSSRHSQSSCPVRARSMECFQCHQKGHTMPTCPQTRCYNCGNFGHSSQRCLSRPLCFHCSAPGHRSTDCQLKTRGRVCYRCKEPGHEMADCSLTALCFTCHQAGHVAARCPEGLCSRCNARGHTAAACTRFLCSSCGGDHPVAVCKRSQQTNAAGREENVPTDSLSHSEGDDGELPSHAVPAPCRKDDIVPPYVLSGVKHDGRVGVIIDGGYFERILKGHEYRDEGHYRCCVEALKYTLDFIGDIFQKVSVAYWFDTDPAAFAEYLENSVPLFHREKAFRENNLRKRLLLDEMNGGGKLSNVVTRFVGRMKRQKGYTPDGLGYVWVQSGVDVAMATCVIDTFIRRQFDQVVLLCGDSDVYPAVQFCHRQRCVSQSLEGLSPVRMCGSSSSMSSLYGQDQDLCDFLPRILLDAPQHTEGDRTIDFPPHAAFL
uniref:Uncharacterized protein TCIL3000_11_9980 n=1 Tax=Trypanosoma congolense (strain IL3000) TaxID=1068625 RepID=G0V1K5_TRYCI|nr:unnamed protein product [Trypanosoma congolense IL3000]